MRHTARTTTSLSFICRYLSEIEGYRFIAGEQAAAYRDNEALKKLGDSPTPTSQQYRALYLSRLGRLDEAEAELTELISTGPSLLRARGLITLAGVDLKRANVGAAELLYKKAADQVSDGFTALYLYRGLTHVASLGGDHRSALHYLERAYQLAQSIPEQHPLRLDLRNSLAVEFDALGRGDLAQIVIAPAIASPVIKLFPEWLETAQEITPPPTRSMIYVPAGYRVPVPTVRGTAVPSSRQEISGARILDFRKQSVDCERMLRRGEAAAIVLQSDSDLLVSDVFKLNEASDQERRIVGEVLDAQPINLELVEWAATAPTDKAKSLLGMAKKLRVAESKRTLDFEVRKKPKK